MKGLFKECDRPDILGVMLDGENFQLIDREVTVVNFWEIEKGSIFKSRVTEISENLKSRGFIVVFRRILDEHHTESSYDLSVEFFTADEMVWFAQEYKFLT